MSERAIVINGVRWTYCIGRAHVVIRDEVRRSRIVSVSELTGMTWDMIERGMWKKGFHITPKQIADHIQKVSQ